MVMFMVLLFFIVKILIVKECLGILMGLFGMMLVIGIVLGLLVGGIVTGKQIGRAHV